MQSQGEIWECMMHTNENVFEDALEMHETKKIVKAHMKCEVGRVLEHARDHIVEEYLNMHKMHVIEEH